MLMADTTSNTGIISSYKEALLHVHEKFGWNVVTNDKNKNMWCVSLSARRGVENRAESSQ